MENTIAKVVFLTAKQMFMRRQYDSESKPKITNSNITFEVESELGNVSYNVRIEWPELMPRIPKPATKIFKFSCTCGGYKNYDPKFCKYL